MITRKYKSQTSNNGTAFLLATGKDMSSEFDINIRFCDSNGYIEYERQLVGDSDTLDYIDQKDNWKRIY